MELKKKTVSLIKNFLSRYALTLIYCFVVMKLILTPYLKGTHFLLMAGFAVYECVLFYLFEKIKLKKVVRGLFYMGICLVVSIITYFIVTTMNIDTRYSFIEWFYLDINSVGEVMPYVYALFFMLGLFVVSITYYFTIIRFRSLGLLLVSIFPFSIYGKRAESLSAFEITLMLTVFLALIVHAGQVSDEKRPENKGTLIINRAYIGTMALFVTFVGALTMVMPKPEIKSQLEKNKDLFNFQLIKIQKTDYDDLNNKSSPRFGANSTGEELFNFMADKPQDVFYLRRQSFDCFENNQWIDRKGYRMENYAPGLSVVEYRYLYDPRYVRDMFFRMLQKKDFDSYNVNIGVNPEEAEKRITQNKIYEYSDSFGPSYIPAPLNTNPAEIEDTASAVNISYRGDMLLSGTRNLLNATIYYTVEDKNLYDMVEKSSLTWEKYLDMLRMAKDKKYLNEKMYNAFVNQYNRYKYGSEYSDKLKNLAEKITADCKSDYEKAKALEDYFQNNGYTYDLSYEPEDESIDYFIFTSKKGNCTSFATAMTLMAKAVDLPARYVEGFACNERDEKGNYIVRDSCAHAFVEVLVPGFGWMTFDPTVTGFLDNIKKADNGGDGIDGGAVATFVSYFSKFILFFAAVFLVVVFVLLDRIMEGAFRIRLKFASSEKKIYLLYRHILKLLENSSGQRLKGKTPDELAEFANVHRNADISEITNLFEQVIFGGILPDENQINKVYDIYKNNYNLIAKKPKAKKKTV